MLLLSSFPCPARMFTSSNQLSQPFRESCYGSPDPPPPCPQSLPRSQQKSRPGKGTQEDGCSKRRASPLLEASGPLWADVARSGELAQQLVLWGTLQAAYIKSRPAWKAFRRKRNIPPWQDVQRKISSCQLDPLLSPLFYFILLLFFFPSAFG